MAKMRLFVTGIALMLVALGTAWGAEEEVKIVTNRAEVAGCGEMVALVKDDDPKDLKRKAAKKGGTHVLITGTGVLGGSDPLVNPFHGDRAVMTGMVFICPAGYTPASQQPAKVEDDALRARIKALEERVSLLEAWVEVLKQQKK